VRASSHCGSGPAKPRNCPLCDRSAKSPQTLVSILAHRRGRADTPAPHSHRCFYRAEAMDARTKTLKGPRSPFTNPVRGCICRGVLRARTCDSKSSTSLGRVAFTVKTTAHGEYEPQESSGSTTQPHTDSQCPKFHNQM